LMRFSRALSTMSLLRRRRRRLRFLLLRPWLPPHLERRMRPLPLSLKRLAAARQVFIFVMREPPWESSGRLPGGAFASLGLGIAFTLPCWRSLARGGELDGLRFMAMCHARNVPFLA